MTKLALQSTPFEPFCATVDARILDELPRFFPGSVDRMLAELLQNACRAGASQVDVTFDAARRMLVIVDDGCGIRHPQVVLHAGHTGWDEARIVEPAGLGFFSLLDGRLVESVVVSSRNWRLALRPHDRDGRPVQAEPLAAPIREGTRLEITLAESARTAKGERLMAQRLRDELLPRALGLYPFRLTLFIRDVDHVEGEGVVISPLRFNADIQIDLPCGAVQWRATNCGCAEPVWEQAFIGNTELRAAMQRAAEAHPVSALAKALVRNTSLRWQIASSCGVRPVLPHRNALQPGEALNDAASQIVHALVERVLSDAAAQSGAWPDRIPDVPDMLHPSPRDQAYWHKSDGLRRAVLEHLGWQTVSYIALDEPLSLWRDHDDSLNVDVTERTFHDRRALVVRSQSLAASLNAHLHLQDVPAVWEPNTAATAHGVEVRIANLRVGQGLVAACDRITIVRAGSAPIDVPFLVAVEDEFDLPGYELPGCAIVFAGDSRALWHELQRSQQLTNAAFLYRHYVGHDGWYEWVDDDATVLADVVQRALIDSFVADFEPANRAAQVAWHASMDALKQLSEAQHMLDRARQSLKRRGLPTGFKGATGPAVLSRRLKHATSVLSREACRWQIAAGLADNDADGE